MGSTVRLALPVYPSLGTGSLACKELVTCQVALGFKHLTIDQHFPGGQ